MSELLIQQTGGVLRLTLNRPESLNAFSREMIEGLIAALRDAQTREDIRTVVIGGAGRSFSAGGDVKTMGVASPVDVYDHVAKLNECVLAIRALEKPIIASIHGFAAGAGFNLALACDLIVAAEDSRFVLSFTQVGLMSDGGGSYFLPRIIGPQLAKELFFLGEPLSAQRAHQLGIVNRLVNVAELEQETMALAERLAQGPSKAYGMQKRVIDMGMTMTLADVLQAELTAQSMISSTADHREGAAAFREKRKPIFQGK